MSFINLEQLPFAGMSCIPATSSSYLPHRNRHVACSKTLMTVLLLLALLVLLPAAVALLSEPSLLPRAATRPAFRVGAPIVYREQAVSTRPIADAHDIRPAERGDYYYYSIIYYLRVVEVLGDGRIIAVARNHQRLCLWPNDSCLRKARLTERLMYHLRFLRVQT
jgi:hypothetical protein